MNHLTDFFLHQLRLARLLTPDFETHQMHGVDLFPPESILKWINPNFDLNKFENEQKTRLTAAE